MDCERVSCTVTAAPVGTWRSVHGGGDLVHVLAARAGAAREFFLEVRRLQSELREARGFSGVKVGWSVHFSAVKNAPHERTARVPERDGDEREHARKDDIRAVGPAAFVREFERLEAE